MIFTTASAIMAKNFRHGNFGSRSMDLTTLVEELNLTETQKEQVEAIIARYRDGKESLVENLREAREQLSTMIFAEGFDEAAVRLSFQQVSSIMEELVVLKAKMIAELRTVLDPEQIGYLKGRIDARKDFRNLRRPPKKHLNQ